MGKAMKVAAKAGKPRHKKALVKDLSGKRAKAGTPVKKKPRPVQNSDGFYSGKFLPRSTLVGGKAVKTALKIGSIVLTIDGQFIRVPLTQKLQYQAPCPPDKQGDSRIRHESFMHAKSLKEALIGGAQPNDIFYDLKKGHLEFVPVLKGKVAEGPLPFSQWPDGIRVSERNRPWWLPDDWAHGVKTTCVTYLPVYIAPNSRTYFHREVIEKIVEQQLGGLDGMVDWAKKQLSEGRDWTGQPVKFDPDAKLFACLTKGERAKLPSGKELHVAIISARRATERTGIRGIVNVQTRCLASGIRPRWYVDADSLSAYRRLGLDAVVGGKLTPSRNKALRDAQQMGKACVQMSDDISRWEYHNGDLTDMEGRSEEKMRCANELVKSRSCLVISPAAAARFLLAKMRAAEGPQLGGVYPSGNASFGLLCDAISTEAFILGDFFVHDDSPCRFDESITLKEDYDFTCSHLQRHGSVLRCNRIIVHASHETNPGGAVAVRDKKGKKERENIGILRRKWPGVFKPHGTRGDTQVRMVWSSRQNK
ncbi:unnamed protein product [Polarella glacialis]|uniref:Uncharacterized protein n=1 Tax=Polarella glacialis TaxID=89957 RepID=A0A813GVZ3_POLGL|nr:unnamed protein product [Polarella glacialis]